MKTKKSAAKRYSLTGGGKVKYCSSVVTVCAAATNAIGEGFLKIRDGYLDIVVAGGSKA